MPAIWHLNSIDIELDTEDTEAFINACKLMGPTFGGINLEDIIPLDTVRAKLSM